MHTSVYGFRFRLYFFDHFFFNALALVLVLVRASTLAPEVRSRNFLGCKPCSLSLT